MQTRRGFLSSLAILLTSLSCNLPNFFCPRNYYELHEGSPEKPPVVINSGTWDSPGTLDPYVKFFQDRDHTTLIWDYSPTANSVNEVTNELESLVEQTNLQKPIILGYSLGGITALNYATNHPENYTSLVLISSAHRLTKPDADRCPPEFFSRFALFLNAASTNLEISQISEPVLSIHADEDIFFSQEAFADLEHNLQNCRREIVQGANHGLPITHVDKVLDALERNYGFINN